MVCIDLIKVGSIILIILIAISVIGLIIMTITDFYFMKELNEADKDRNGITIRKS